MTGAGNSELLVPFVVCASKGGPYADDAYVAGFEAGQLDQFLTRLSLPPGGMIRYPVAVHAPNRDQLDLIAMRHGLVVEFAETEDDTWLYMAIGRPGPVAGED